jgi:hypothetical protein
MLKIDRFDSDDSVVFLLCGRIETGNVIQLESLIAVNSKPIVFDLKEVNLVSREVVRFFSAVPRRWNNHPKLPRLYP